MSVSFDFRRAPGHLVRRAHQRAVALFMEETGAFDVTPVQYAILCALEEQPGQDQITLAGRVALDAATSGSVLGRLEARGWVRRESDAQDRRRRLLWITAAGAQAAQQMHGPVRRAQERLVQPLSPEEQAQMLQLLGKLTNCPP